MQSGSEPWPSKNLLRGLLHGLQTRPPASTWTAGAEDSTLPATPQPGPPSPRTLAWPTLPPHPKPGPPSPRTPAWPTLLPHPSLAQSATAPCS